MDFERSLMRSAIRGHLLVRVEAERFALELGDLAWAGAAPSLQVEVLANRVVE